MREVRWKFKIWGDLLKSFVSFLVVTEALVVYSSATVVWQDGTIETDISSVDLCPIHHLGKNFP